MKAIKIILWIIAVIVTITVISLIGRSCNYANRALDVAQEELDPAELLRKYEWFKDASAQLDKKLADINVYEERINFIKESENVSRTDKEQMYIWMSEVSGVKASYNTLAAEYNSQMAKINWAFTNVGQLPEGATESLPREYKPYIES